MYHTYIYCNIYLYIYMITAVIGHFLHNIFTPVSGRDIFIHRSIPLVDELKKPSKSRNEGTKGTSAKPTLLYLRPLPSWFPGNFPTEELTQNHFFWPDRHNYLVEKREYQNPSTGNLYNQQVLMGWYSASAPAQLWTSTVFRSEMMYTWWVFHIDI